MSSAEAAKRREMLEALRAKRIGVAKPTSPVKSPERTVLVPPSSPPAVSSPVSNAFPSGSHHGISIIASSGLPGSSSSRPAPAPAKMNGSPEAIMKAMNGRREEEQRTNGGGSSLSYDTPLPSLDNLFDSPGKPSTPAVPRTIPTSTPSTSTPSATLKRNTPSLIAAAQASKSAGGTSTDGREIFIKRTMAQYPKITRSQIVELLHRHPHDRRGVLKAIDALVGGTSTGASASPTTSTSHVQPKLQHQAAAPAPRPPAPAPAPAPPTPVAKSKKNENSAIYAKRGSNGKKKGGSGSESEGELSEDGSEMEWSDEDGPSRKKRKGENVMRPEVVALKAFNEAPVEELTGTIACSSEQAATVIKHRPYENVEEVRRKLTKARGVSFKLFEQYEEIMEGYVQIDACLTECESIASDVAGALAIWRSASQQNDSVVGTPRADGLNDVKVDVKKVSELLRNETDKKRRRILSSYIQTQPSLLSEGTTLKDYQLLGVNWLNLLWSKEIGCILADEMGLGKTIQVISFIAHLKQKGNAGPHLILVPASTLENWVREFEKFAPKIDVEAYYGSQGERAEIRDHLKKRFRKGNLEVVLASYTQMVSQDDLGFFRKKIQFQTCVYDEGHKLKNCATKAYTDLLSIKPRWRLLLTGTPLQNNLQELISLLVFIHKDVFEDAESYLRAMFKSSNQVNLLAQQRVSRARVLLTPFVLRRRKATVLSLPPKIESVQHCDMTAVQAKLYRETLGRSKKILEAMDDATLEAEAAAGDDDKQATKPSGGAAKKATAPAKKNPDGNATHIIMDLRKAASHPLLFRRLYDTKKIRQIAKECLNTPTWCDSNYDYVVEDLEVMSDAELHHFCTESDYTQIRKFALDEKVFLEGGKVKALQKLVDRCKTENKRMLLFSQFTMVLDILQVALAHLGVRYTRLDGQTKTDERQGLVDEFNDDEEITVFLLSTKAGGVGINLTAASVVVIYDQDFNPHNDRQAADRAYRIGQEKEVEVIKLITKDSIDEDMLNIGITKLKLDDAVGGEEITLGGDGGNEDKTAKEARKSLLTTLRNKFEAGDGAGTGAGKASPLSASIKEEGEDEEITEPAATPIKVARASGLKEEVV